VDFSFNSKICLVSKTWI